MRNCIFFLSHLLENQRKRSLADLISSSCGWHASQTCIKSRTTQRHRSLRDPELTSPRAPHPSHLVTAAGLFASARSFARDEGNTRLPSMPPLVEPVQDLPRLLGLKDVRELFFAPARIAPFALSPLGVTPIKGCSFFRPRNVFF